METIKEILMRRDNLSSSEADDRIEEAKEVFNMWLERGDIDSAEHVLEEYFGLEPDYIDEFLD